jgi:hypothetical protein
MRVKCIENRPDLTKVRWYDVQTVSDESNYYYVIDDYGHGVWVRSNSFIKLEDIRRYRINEILGDAD